MDLTLLWPLALILLAVVPILLLAYLWMLQRRQRFVLRYSSVSLLKEASGVGSRIRRHVPPALFLLSLTFMITALARPSAQVTVPALDATVILSIDVSRSMRAGDIAPTRIEAAKNAARAFVEEQPEGVRIGVVAFAGNAALVQAPTDDKIAVIGAIRRLELQSSTAIGEGLLAAMKAFYPTSDLEESEQVRPGVDPRGQLEDDFQRRPRELPMASKPGPWTEGVPLPNPGVIVLLSDGQNRSGIDPMEVVPQAKDLGIPVYTVGIGGPGSSGGMRGALDAATLKQIAEMTGGEYFSAESAGSLSSIYQKLAHTINLRTERTELTAYITALAAVIAVAGGMLSLLWFNRLP